MTGFEASVFCSSGGAYAYVKKVEVVLIDRDDQTIVRVEDGGIRVAWGKIYNTEEDAWKACRSGMVAIAAKATTEARRIGREVLGEHVEEVTK